MNSVTSQIAQHSSAQQDQGPIAEPIAIIGIGCRFPGGASDPAAFWRLLRDSVDAIEEVPPTRWDADAFYAPRAATPGKTVTRWGGFLEHVDRFDAAFFGITPREATYMDPQHRLLLEVAWEALEHAGVPVETLAGSPTSVFIGISGSDYAVLQTGSPEQIGQYTGMGSAVNVAAGRLAYLFDLQGPAVAVDTGQSSSLVAVHLACQSLRTGESQMALAGGVKLMLSPAGAIAYSQMHVLASDGRCKTFDQRADGFVPGEGCGLVVLKRLADALADGDPILAVIRGSAINQDGRSSSLSAPNPTSQQAVIRRALSSAGIAPGSVSYVETHGSGTPLGDSTEVGALGAVLGQVDAQSSPCVLGAVKTNIGHLDTAAGIAGLIKTVLALHHGRLPANLNFQQLNPQIKLDGTRFVIPTTSQPWPAEVSRRIAGVSAFGWSGTNAHVVVEAAPQIEQESPAQEDRAYLLPISARHPDALRELVRRYQSLLSDPAARSLHDIAYTASVRRTHHAYRLALVGGSAAALAEQAEIALLDDTREPIGEEARLVFVFPGQGAQWAGMGRDLLAAEPVFREMIDACAVAFRPYVTWDLREQLCDPMPDPPIDVIQPTLFAVSIALAALWESWGVVPAAVVGHSLGEVAAAYVAGALSLDDAARIICIRSQLQRRCSGQGAMAMVDLSEAEAEALLASYRDRLSVAALNGPHSTVISGDPEALDAVMAALEARQIFCRRVNVDIAAHSPHMDPLLEPFREALAELQPRRSKAQFYSSVTSSLLDGDRLDAGYWLRNLREPVRFNPALAALIDAGYQMFVEVSPHPILAQAVKNGLDAAGHSGVVLPSLRRHEDSRATLLTTLGALYTAGYPVVWQRLYPQGGRCVTLPGYPWQREHFWIEGARAFPGLHAAANHHSENGNHNGNGKHRLAGTQIEIRGAQTAAQSEYLYRLHWEPQERLAGSTLPPFSEQWLIFADAHGVGSQLATSLEARGVSCVLVTPGTNGLEGQDRHYRLDPSRPEAFRQLLHAVSADSRLRCRHVICLWGLAAAGGDGSSGEDRHLDQRDGLMGALHLTQALARSGWRDLPRLWLVTRGTQPVGDGPGAARLLEQASLWGFGRTVMYEHPELDCSLLDLPAAGMDGEADALIAEVLGATGENQIAIREDRRYVARLTHAPPAAGKPESIALPAAETLIVAGSLGPTGLTIARQMVEQGVRHLALVSCEGPTAAERGALDGITAAGATISRYQSDLAQPDQAAALLATIAETHPPLRGVIYIADPAEHVSIARLDAERLGAELAHARAAWNLHALTLDRKLDYFLLGSSIAGTLGLGGQGASAAVASFFAALACYRRARGLAALSLGWSAPSAADSANGRLANQGLKRLSAAEVVAALQEAIRQNAAHVGAMSLNLRQWLQVNPQAATLPVLTWLVHEQKQSSVPRAASSLRDELLAAEPEQRLALLEGHLKDQVSKILRRVPAKIDRNKPLGALGMDSLMGLELRNRLEDTLALQLPVTLIWNYQTIAALSQHLAEKLGLALEAPPPAKQPGLVLEPPPPALAQPPLEQDMALAMLLSEIDKYSVDELRHAFSD